MDGSGNRMRNDVKRRGADPEHDDEQGHGQPGGQDHRHRMPAGKLAELNGRHEHGLDDQRQLHPGERDDGHWVVELDHRDDDGHDRGADYHRDDRHDDGRIDRAS